MTNTVRFHPRDAPDRRTPARTATKRPAMRAPDCHLLLEIEGLESVQRPVVDALLRLDLGARIRADTAHATLDIEGRFHQADVVALIHALGCRVRRVEERPLSPRPVTLEQLGWS